MAAIWTHGAGLRQTALPVLVPEPWDSVGAPEGLWRLCPHVLAKTLIFCQFDACKVISHLHIQFLEPLSTGSAIFSLPAGTSVGVTSGDSTYA